ncbi:MAG: methylenetetrahydrofolate reductase [Candidatus Omnitrophica bacterium]|nr:methylenetetrahydrofolate reductase [Candidatus Omnitrophota bacterium]
MSLREKLETNRFVVTSEIGPPKGTEIKEALEDAELIKDMVDAINVTDLQSSVMRLGSLAVCRLLKEKKIEPILQITCRDRNRLALQSDLLSAYVLGIENVLLLTGDHTTLGDHPEAKPVFDLDSVQLIQVANNLQKGKDMKGNDLKGSPKFFIGAVVNPGADPLEPEIIKMEKKIDAGAQFFQTQAVYDIDIFKKFLDNTRHLKTKVLAGIVLLKSAGMAKYMNENVAGVHVPDSLIKEISSVSKEDRPKKSVEIAVRLMKELKPLSSGIHLMPLGWDKLVPEILKGAGF